MLRSHIWKCQGSKSLCTSEACLVFELVKSTEHKETASQDVWK